MLFVIYILPHFLIKGKGERSEVPIKTISRVYHCSSSLMGEVRRGRGEATFGLQYSPFYFTLPCPLPSREGN
jgi:hypothetical protein